MEEKSNWFLQAFMAFKESPVKFISFSLLCLSFAILYQQNDFLIDSIPTNEVRNAYFQDSLERDKLINNSLQYIIDHYGADGVKIIQYHNGTEDLTSVPFLYSSVTFFAGDLKDSVELYKDRPLSLMANFNYKLWKPTPQCSSFFAAGLEDSTLRKTMRMHEYEFIIACPIKNSQDYPIGYITAGYEKTISPEQAKETIKYMANASDLIGGYLKPYKK